MMTSVQVYLHVGELSPDRSDSSYIMPPSEAIEAWKWVDTEKKTRKGELCDFLSFLANNNGHVVQEAYLSGGTGGW